MVSDIFTRMIHFSKCIEMWKGCGFVLWFVGEYWPSENKHIYYRQESTKQFGMYINDSFCKWSSRNEQETFYTNWGKNVVSKCLYIWCENTESYLHYMSITEPLMAVTELVYILEIFSNTTTSLNSWSNINLECLALHLITTKNLSAFTLLLWGIEPLYNKSWVKEPLLFK